MNKRYDGEYLDLRDNYEKVRDKNIDLTHTVERQAKAIEQLKTETGQLNPKYEILREQHELIKHKYWGRSSEKGGSDDRQGELFNEAEAEAAEEKDPETVTVPEHARRKKGHGGGSKKLPANLPRVEVVNDLPESEKHCRCGGELEKIGEERAERLEISEPKLWVKVTVTPKYACPKCHGKETSGGAVRQADTAPSIIPGGMAGPSLLSYILRAKYLDMQPFYRLESGFERLGIEISRQDMAAWQIKVAQALKPLYTLLKETLKTWHILRMDETSVQVMGKKGARTRGNHTSGLRAGVRRANRRSYSSMTRSIRRGRL
jgi:transposase